MKPEGNESPPASFLQGLAHGIQQALEHLLQAHEYARQEQLSVWDFAVEIDRLRAIGLTDTDLRWLAFKNYVEHATETTRTGKDRRSFRRSGRLKFTRKTCVVLTDAGAAMARRIVRQRKRKSKRAWESRAQGAALPVWDGKLRELRLGDQVVKQFRQPAPSQEKILAAFEEEGWPAHIDDPLPPQPERDSKRQLHNTINNLNRHHKERVIRFAGDGNGNGIRWEFLFS